ncbi:hypothetical protein SBA2_280006 [Acidobacteriia bacterium SbA2]|nr:hypothetical protein SBA2_280006 [Acidobacteriia bacterium SbA2]
MFMVLVASDAKISPEGALYHSPGQRPGFANTRFHSRQALKGRNSLETRPTLSSVRAVDYHALSGLAISGGMNIGPRPMAWAMFGRPFGAERHPIED